MPSGAFTGNIAYIPFRLKDVKLNALQNDYLGLSKLWVCNLKIQNFNFQIRCKKIENFIDIQKTEYVL